MTLIVLRDKKQTSQRTRNRVTEHQHHGWTMTRGPEIVRCFRPGESGIFMACPCDWTGWLPWHEIESAEDFPQPLEPDPDHHHDERALS